MPLIQVLLSHDTRKEPRATLVCSQFSQTPNSTLRLSRRDEGQPSYPYRVLRSGEPAVICNMSQGPPGMDDTTQPGGTQMRPPGAGLRCETTSGVS